MIEKGEYTIIDLLCISHSLLEQLNSDKPLDSKNETIYKAVLEFNDKKIVAYFLGKIEIGQNSVIRIKSDKDYPLLYDTDYIVIRKTSYITNKRLLESLLNKQKSRI